MEINYNILNSLKSSDNELLIQYLDKILNHRVNNEVWDWEFNTLPNTIFTVASSGAEIVGTQSMLPIDLRIDNVIVNTAKSETSYLDANYRGKQIFEKLYLLAVDKTVEKQSKLIWGFTPAIKAWKKNLSFNVFEEEMIISVTPIGYYSFIKNKKKSRNLLFAAGKYIVANLKAKTNSLKKTALLKKNVSISINNNLRNINDINELYKQINLSSKALIHIDLNHNYTSWRLTNNPVIKYKQHYFYQNDKLVGYVIYSLRENTLVIADITFNLDKNVLKHIMRYVLDNTSKYYDIEYWGNKSNDVNKDIFDLLTKIGGSVRNDKSRNFVYKIFDDKYDNSIVNNLNNWYINGLWTEGFHI